MKPQCPSCRSFVSLEPYIQLRTEWIMCRSCGKKIHCPSVFDVALVTGTRRAETTASSLVQGATFQNDPKGNALSVLKPNGKLGKIKDKSDSRQLVLFGGAA